jgi:hypothetical protein
LFRKSVQQFPDLPIWLITVDLISITQQTKTEIKRPFLA